MRAVSKFLKYNNKRKSMPPIADLLTTDALNVETVEVRWLASMLMKHLDERIQAEGESMTHALEYDMDDRRIERTDRTSNETKVTVGYLINVYFIYSDSYELF